MIRRGVGMGLTAAMLVAPTSGMARAVIPPTLVGPPDLIIFMAPACRVSITEPGGAGSGPSIPFPALKLGVSVARTTTSFPTGGSGTANFTLAEQRKALGLRYEPPIVDTRSAKLAATFTTAQIVPATRPVYQRLLLTPSGQVARPTGMIFARTTSETCGWIVSLALYFAERPAAASRLRVTATGSREKGCPDQAVDIYAPRTAAATLRRLVTTASNGCNWIAPEKCTRAQWPSGRVVFVSPTYGNAYEYRWVDYDLLADWYFPPDRKR